MSLFRSKNDCHKFVTWAAAWKGGSCDWINLAETVGPARSAEWCLVKEVSELLSVNAANEYTFRRPLAAFLGWEA